MKWTEERRAQAAKLYEAGASLQEVAARLGSTAHRIADVVRAAGVAIRPRGAPMERNGFWKGGRTTDPEGYILLKVQAHPHANASGYVREHRLVMEQVLGRHLTSQEVVHHRNGDPTDNRPENLELFPSNGSHLAHELKGRCPNWTPEGLAAMAAEAQRKKGAAKPKSREAVNARARELYALRRTRQAPTP